MKERLVRGELLVPVVRMLKVQRRTEPVPDLGAWERDLLARRIAPTTWYALMVFDSLLQTVHRFVLDGSEAAARRLGVGFAAADLATEASQRRRREAGHDAAAELTAFAARWRELFNFGACELEELPHEPPQRVFRIRFTGYPDMSACLGHAVAGYVASLVEAAGSSVDELHVDERPWMHNNVLTLRVLCRPR
jgi:hypothetical protein